MCEIYQMAEDDGLHHACTCQVRCSYDTVSLIQQIRAHALPLKRWWDREVGRPATMASNQPETMAACSDEPSAAAEATVIAHDHAPWVTRNVLRVGQGCRQQQGTRVRLHACLLGLHAWLCVNVCVLCAVSACAVGRL